MLSPDQFPTFHTSRDVWSEGIINMPGIGRKLYPKTSDGTPATRGYRIVPGEEMRSYENKGVIHSLSGQVHASPYPDPLYPWESRWDDTHHVLEIDMRPDDGWESKEGMGGSPYAVNRNNSVPLDRITRRWDFPDMSSMKRTVRDHLRSDES
jgi:hypothetical protein